MMHREKRGKFPHTRTFRMRQVLRSGPLVLSATVGIQQDANHGNHHASEHTEGCILFKPTANSTAKYFVLRQRESAMV